MRSDFSLSMSLGVQPTIQELTDAIRSLANGKAVGPDGVSIALLKKNEGLGRVRQLKEYLAGSAPRQDIAEDHCSPSQ